MVNTRSQVAENQRPHMCRPDRHSDTESESSVPEVLTREQINEFDNGNLLDFSGESERQAVNQRFTEMNRQISELTNLVLALTEKISSNEKSSSNDREGNVPNITTSNELDARSDSTFFPKLIIRILVNKSNCPKTTSSGLQVMVFHSDVFLNIYMKYDWIDTCPSSSKFTLRIEVYRTTSPVRYQAGFQENVLSGIQPDILQCPAGYYLNIITLNNRNI